MPLLQRSEQIDYGRVVPGRRYRIGVAAYRKRGSSGLVERVVHVNPGSGGAAEEFGQLAGIVGDLDRQGGRRRWKDGCQPAARRRA